MKAPDRAGAAAMQAAGSAAIAWIEAAMSGASTSRMRALAHDARAASEAAYAAFDLADRAEREYAAGADADASADRAEEMARAARRAADLAGGR